MVSIQFHPCVRAENTSHGSDHRPRLRSPRTDLRTRQESRVEGDQILPDAGRFHPLQQDQRLSGRCGRDRQTRGKTSRSSRRSLLRGQRTSNAKHASRFTPQGAPRTTKEVPVHRQPSRRTTATEIHSDKIRTAVCERLENRPLHTPLKHTVHLHDNLTKGYLSCKGNFL